MLPGDEGRAPREDQVRGWRANPDRTLLVVEGSGERPEIACWQLDPSGVVTQRAPSWTLTDEEPGSWTVLGWAGTHLLALWRRRDARSELWIVDVEDGTRSVRHRLLGRPVRCVALESGRLAVLVAVSNGERPLLCLHHPDSDSYQPIDGSGTFRGVGAWDAERSILAVNLDARDGRSGIRLWAYGAAGPAGVEPPWPAGVRPVSAAGHGAGIVGLTGADAAGQPLPGVLELVTGAVRWFPGQGGYSCGSARHCAPVRTM